MEHRHSITTDDLLVQEYGNIEQIKMFLNTNHDELANYINKIKAWS